MLLYWSRLPSLIKYVLNKYKVTKIDIVWCIFKMTLKQKDIFIPLSILTITHCRKKSLQKRDFASEVKFEFCISCMRAFFSALTWHPIFPFWSRHSNFTFEKESKTFIVFLIIFQMISYIFKKTPQLQSYPFDGLHHIFQYGLLKDRPNIVIFLTCIYIKSSHTFRFW